jgi:AmiR/NasT family two-component response regulator
MMLHNLSAIVAGSNLSSRVLLCEILRASGMRDVREAESGAEAFAKACQRSPNLFVVSVEDFAQTLAAIEAFRACQHEPIRRLPILTATSAVTLPQAMALRDAGVDEIILRPFTVAKVLTRIDAAVTYRRSFIDAATYVGPDRRRQLQETFRGPYRRAADAAPDVLEIA